MKIGGSEVVTVVAWLDWGAVTGAPRCPTRSRGDLASKVVEPLAARLGSEAWAL